MEIIGVISLLAGIIQLVILIIIIVKFLLLVKDVNEIKEKMTIPSCDFVFMWKCRKSKRGSC